LCKEITMFKKLIKKSLFLGFIFVVCYGCKPPVPEDIIQPEKMGKILYDIHVVDSYINTMGNQDSAKKVASAYYKGVYKKFAIDSVAYHKSMDFYYKNPEIMSDMYKQLEAQLKKTKTRKEKAEELANKKRIKQDSLRVDSVIKVAVKKADSIKAVKKADSLLKIKKALQKKERLKTARKLKDVNNKSTLK